MILDLALVADKPVPRETIWALRESFSESDLPFRVDILDLAAVPPGFRISIQNRHLPVQ